MSSTVDSVEEVDQSESVTSPAKAKTQTKTDCDIKNGDSDEKENGGTDKKANGDSDEKENGNCDEKENGGTDKKANDSVEKGEEAEEKDGESKVSAEELNKKIVRQVEYYFGDFNLPKDKFLAEEVKKDDGWVPMTVMLKFKRLSSLSDDATVVCRALSESSLVEVSEDGTKIRRSADHPLPVLDEQRKQQLVQRSLYVKGFPTDLTLDAVMEYFNELGGMEHVQMRRWNDKASGSWNFKGSVYVTFADREKAEKVLSQAPLKYEESELMVKWQKEHIDEKQAERGGNKNRNAAKKKSSDEEHGDEEKSDVTSTEHLLGTVLHLKGLLEDVKWSDIKDAVEGLQSDSVAYVDFSTGDVEGYVRFKEADGAKKLFEKLEEAAQLKIGEGTVEVRVLDGEEEVKYLDAQQSARAQRSSVKRKRGGHSRGRGSKRRRGGH